MNHQLQLEEPERLDGEACDVSLTGTLAAPVESTGLPRLPAVIVGQLIAFSGRSVMVDYPSNGSGELIPARSLVPLNETQVGSEVALVFEDGDSMKPMILGVVQNANVTTIQPQSFSASFDGERDHQSLVLAAEEEIILRCGKASITLTRAGKILLRGAYLLSRSSGVNRIKGGSVQIN